MILEMENHRYPIYGFVIISLNHVINCSVEPSISRFCWDHNLQIRHNSRDFRKVVAHFIAKSIIDSCVQFQDTTVIFNYSSLELKILDESLQHMFHKCVLKLLKNMNICTVDLRVKINELQQHHIDDIKIMQQKCHMTNKNFIKLKKFFESNALTFLHKDITHNIVTQHVLSK